MIYLVFRNENSYKIWYTNSSFQELISSACYGFTYKIWGIATYQPREGPETQRFLYSDHKLHLGIRTYLPREGAETSKCQAHRYSYKRQYSYLSTSRGAGNFLLR